MLFRSQVSSALIRVGEAHTTNSKAGPFLGKARLAITGQNVSPPLFESMVALGRERSLVRLEATVAALTQEEGADAA